MSDGFIEARIVLIIISLIAITVVSIKRYQKTISTQIFSIIIIFWSGVASTAITDKTESGALLFFLGIMTVLVLLDSLKVLMADRVKSRLESGFILKFRLVSGVALIFFGVVMLVRVL